MGCKCRFASIKNAFYRILMDVRIHDECQRWTQAVKYYCFFIKKFEIFVNDVNFLMKMDVGFQFYVVSEVQKLYEGSSITAFPASINGRRLPFPKPPTFVVEIDVVILAKLKALGCLCVLLTGCAAFFNFLQHFTSIKRCFSRLVRERKFSILMAVG